MTPERENEMEATVEVLREWLVNKNQYSRERDEGVSGRIRNRLAWLCCTDSSFWNRLYLTSRSMRSSRIRILIAYVRSKYSSTILFRKAGDNTVCPILFHSAFCVAFPRTCFYTFTSPLYPLFPDQTWPVFRLGLSLLCANGERYIW